MPQRARYLIIDGHSVIFAWPELRKLHARRSSLAREALIKRLRDYQDWTAVHVVVVFDGKGRKIEATSDPADVQVFYSRTGQTADAIIERLASKYAKRFELMVATSDSLEGETVEACGAEWISRKHYADFLSLWIVNAEALKRREDTGALPKLPQKQNSSRSVWGDVLSECESASRRFESFRSSKIPVSSQSP